MMPIALMLLLLLWDFFFAILTRRAFAIITDTATVGNVSSASCLLTDPARMNFTT